MAAAIDTNVLSNLGLLQKPATREANSDMGEDAFMKLIIAQMENQDPLKPMENTEFMSQLAQFKSVTGIDELKLSVEKMAGALQSNQALQASSLVGRWVEVPSANNFLWDEVGMAGNMELPVNSTNVQVLIKDSTGQTVKTLALGEQTAGSVAYQWDGVGEDGAVYSPGEYTVEAIASIDGDAESLKTNTFVPVESVLMGRAGEAMRINTAGLGEIKLSTVKQIM